MLPPAAARGRGARELGKRPRRGDDVQLLLRGLDVRAGLLPPLQVCLYVQHLVLAERGGVLAGKGGVSVCVLCLDFHAAQDLGQVGSAVVPMWCRLSNDGALFSVPCVFPGPYRSYSGTTAAVGGFDADGVDLYWVDGREELCVGIAVGSRMAETGCCYGDVGPLEAAGARMRFSALVIAVLVGGDPFL